MATSSATGGDDLIRVQNYSMHEALKPHYEYVGSSKSGDKVVYNCKHCNKEKSGKRNSTGNFRRHLEVSTRLVSLYPETVF